MPVFTLPEVGKDAKFLRRIPKAETEEEARIRVREVSIVISHHLFLTA